jgi:hypothetical protein
MLRRQPLHAGLLSRLQPSASGSPGGGGGGTMHCGTVTTPIRPSQLNVSAKIQAWRECEVSLVGREGGAAFYRRSPAPHHPALLAAAGFGAGAGAAGLGAAGFAADAGFAAAASGCAVVGTGTAAGAGAAASAAGCGGDGMPDGAGDAGLGRFASLLPAESDRGPPRLPMIAGSRSEGLNVTARAAPDIVEKPVPKPPPATRARASWVP